MLTDEDVSDVVEDIGAEATAALLIGWYYSQDSLTRRIFTTEPVEE